MKEFFDESIQKEGVKYAILSHTWGEEEISFTDWTFITENPDSDKAERLRQKTGYRKIMGFVERVRELSKTLVEDNQQLDWAWVDTCAIDKRSSAELSEAINCMYKWYKRAHICFAYLSDVRAGDSISAPDSDFMKSRWFTRGWTLQELIAPVKVEFLNEEWKKIATKYNNHVLLERITGIPFTKIRKSISGFGLTDFSCAQKMSWAASRQTTREEDMAYCLIGLFGIHMPLLYGEGKRAFIRLQEEIVKKWADHTIFAWRLPEQFYQWPVQGPTVRSCFATTPKYFTDCSHIVPGSYYNPADRVPVGLGVCRPFEITNIGVMIHLPLLDCSEMKESGIISTGYSCSIGCTVAILLCVDLSRGRDFFMAVPLIRRVDTGNQYARISANSITYIPAEQTMKVLQPRIDSGKLAEEVYLANDSGEGSLDRLRPPDR